MRFVLALGLVSACGAPRGGGEVDPAESGPKAGPVRHALYIDDATKLPACGPEGEAWLVYVKAEKTFKVCSGGAWSNVEIKGEKGDPGTVVEVTPTPAPPSSILVGADSAVIGTMFDPQLLAVEIDRSTAVVRLLSLTSGLSKLADYGRCLHRSIDCSDECFVEDKNLAVYESPTSVWVVTGSEYFLGATSSTFKSTKSNGFACETFDGSTLKRPADGRFPRADVKTISLPLRYLAP